MIVYHLNMQRYYFMHIILSFVIIIIRRNYVFHNIRICQTRFTFLYYKKIFISIYLCTTVVSVGRKHQVLYGPKRRPTAISTCTVKTPYSTT